MYLASAPGALVLNSFSPIFNNATLTVYAGAPPGTAEASLSGNTQLVQYTFSATAFATVATSGGFDVQTSSFVSSSATPTNTGTATFARANFVPSVWAGTTGYLVGQVVSNNSNYYMCILSGTSASSGGPTGTGLAQKDSGTAWSYIGPTTGGTCIAQLSIGVSGADITMANTAIQTGVAATITGLNIQTPVN